MDVLPFNDDRKDLDAEGQASAAFGVPMGRIRFEPSPATLLGQAIISEMQAAGHTVTDGAEGVQIAGSILEFEVNTATTLLYWDVIGNMSVSPQIQVARQPSPRAPMDYRVRCRERTYVWPSEAVIAGTMGKCISAFANELRNDGRVADSLRSLAMKAMAGRDKVNESLRESAAQPRSANEKSYTSLDRRWSLSYPGEWKLDDTDRFVKINKGQAILGVHTLSNVTGNTLDEVADSVTKKWEQQMQKVNTVKRVSRQRVTLAGDLTAIAIVHHIGAGQVGKSQKIIVGVKDRRYLIDSETLLASWPDYERDFNQIIDSFRPLK
jgi:hypothetical protein